MKYFLNVFVIVLACTIFFACGKGEEKSKDVKKETKIEEPEAALRMEAREPAKGENIITSYYPNGKKESEGQFKDGMMVGLWTTWYENGQKEREESYVDSLLNGKRTVWHKNGQMKETAWYKDNKLDGKQSLFDENGAILSEKEYMDGVETTVFDVKASKSQ